MVVGGGASDACHTHQKTVDGPSVLLQDLPLSYHGQNKRTMQTYRKMGYSARQTVVPREEWSSFSTQMESTCDHFLSYLDTKMFFGVP